ncbi:MAG: hypothetical protein EGQ82_07085 [Clostridiales bacterium]|nr:hypothetical protein [Clostridiales bacterium]
MIGKSRGTDSVRLTNCNRFTACFGQSPGQAVFFVCAVRYICETSSIYLSKRKTGIEEAMELSLVYKVIGVGMIVMFSGLVLDRADRKDQSMLVSVAGIVAVLLMLADKLSELFEKIRLIFGI